MIDDLIKKYKENISAMKDIKVMISQYNYIYQNYEKSMKGVKWEIENYIKQEFSQYLKKNNLDKQIDKVDFKGSSFLIFINNNSLIEKNSNIVTDKYKDFVDKYRLKIEIFQF